MIAAHGATITLDGSTLTITYSPLLTALSKSGERDLTLDLSTVTGVQITAPNTLSGGTVELINGSTRTLIPFSPNQEEQATALAGDISSILQGETPTRTAALGSPTTAVTAPDGPHDAPLPGFNFVGFDVETANDDWGSICQIGLVRYLDGREVDAVSWLCAPPEPINFFQPVNIGIHGITPEQVAGQPAFAELLPKMVEFVGELPVVAHNAQFDFTALSRACTASGINAPIFNFGCSLALSRVATIKFENHKLPTVAQALGVDLKKHHDAAEDARACAGIAIQLARHQNHEGSFIDFFHSQGFTLGSLDMEKVYPVLRDRSGANVVVQRRRLGLGGAPDLPGGTESPASNHEAVSAASSNLTSEPAAAEAKKPRGRAPWDKVATPEVIPDPNPDADPDSLLFAQHVTLTGDFEPYEKGALWQRIADQGGQVGKNVTKKTTILVAGPWATITSKQKRAEELKEKGQNIQIWDDKQLFTALGLDDQPPF